MRTDIKRKVWARDRYTCRYCGEKNLKEPTVDHVKPRRLLSEGQKTNTDNLVTACKSCNQAKGGLDISNDPPTIKMRAFKANLYGKD